MQPSQSIGDHPRTILIVDDNQTNMLVLQNVLSHTAYHVHIVRDGAAALAFATQSIPDLILLDIEMPGMNGYEVCEQLKADPVTQNIPIIFISVHDRQDDIVRGFQVGGVDYITKPFQEEEVLARINSHITLVAQRQQLEALYQRDIQRAQAINEMKDQFIHAATHDLKNPLFLISGYVTMLETEREIVNNDFARTALREIQQSVDTMTSLITDILDLVQLESQVGLDCTPVSIRAFLEEALKGFDILAEQKHVRLSLLLPAEDAEVLLDTMQFHRVMDNLLSNAIKYTPEGGWIKIKSYSMPDEVVIEVTDTGMGVPEKDLPHLFEKFYRVNQPEYRAVSGTGLGLSIVKAIVEAHQGQIKVTSKEKKGSSFVITLPRVRT